MPDLGYCMEAWYSTDDPHVLFFFNLREVNRIFDDYPPYINPCITEWQNVVDEKR